MQSTTLRALLLIQPMWRAGLRVCSRVQAYGSVRLFFMLPLKGRPPPGAVDEPVLFKLRQAIYGVKAHASMYGTYDSVCSQTDGDSPRRYLVHVAIGSCCRTRIVCPSERASGHIADSRV